MLDDLEWGVRVLLRGVWRRRRGVYHALTLISLLANVVAMADCPFIREKLTSLTSFLYDIEWSSAANSGIVFYDNIRRWLPEILDSVISVVTERRLLHVVANLIIVCIIAKAGILPLRGTWSVNGGSTGAPADRSGDSTTYHEYNNYSINNNYNRCMIDVHMKWPPGTIHVRAEASVQSTTNYNYNYSTNDHDYSHNYSTNYNSEYNTGPVNHGKINTNISASTTAQELDHTIANPKAEILTTTNDVLTTANDIALTTTNDALITTNDSAKISNLVTNTKSLQKATKSIFSIEPLEVCDNNHSDSIIINQIKESEKDINEDEAANLININGYGELDDESNYTAMSAQELNEKATNFISKFKRSLTMQRQNSFNLLLNALVPVRAGGDVVDSGI